ncbi:hypothetical protein AB0M61_06865 [Streptomyces sp. NPDC051642]|uniref:hypothetical protein n=1 Tax=Streptomyces sp. NPDC051642 TaxID=3154646 RepID=UPI00343F1F3E
MSPLKVSAPCMRGLLREEQRLDLDHHVGPAYLGGDPPTLASLRVGKEIRCAWF